MMEPNSQTKTAVPTGREVLVVEDEERVRTMLARALKEMGFNGTFAGSAESAHKALSQKSFDILILDLNLPGMGGMDFLESVRKKNSDVQAIVLTGFGDLEAARRAIHLDVVEFLTKPCALGNLEAALARAQKRRKQQFVHEAIEAPQAVMQFESPVYKPLNTQSRKPMGDAAHSGESETADSMEQVEYRHILSVLQKHNGSRAQAAVELGISVRKLYYRLGEYQKQGLLPEALAYRPR